ncbi:MULTISPECIES: hypothetical protein [Clostridium]|uniref:Uncharacterized protein n=1 Tax=Clostridium butyricum TaxID=1492 RepID=A0AAP9UFB0_CLOBU|nr:MULTISPECIES: hypothetical protein [Clostridium]ALP90480.1 hypothetical protein ATN24_10130 [Clostridium butyricum]ALS16983.1 hypothetical protein ATD26_08935 [Clostridium butyricum]ANF14100.1 hypothetical protein AZ909_08575 [Clostridium butyricum]AOR94166.1 hypothetical protein BBB49_08755 [Clostridium butyricum]MBS4839820.1 hypothetical protein [Clostridium sp.]
MDIKIASNTPTLVKKILGSNTFNSSENGSVDTQTFTICSNTSYTDNSAITITNIETYYSDLGLLNILSDTTSTERLTTLNLSKDISEESIPSVINTIPNINKLYEETLQMINNSADSKDYISKETYLLLGLQNLVNIDFTISDYISCNDNIKFCCCYDSLKNFINSAWTIIHSICICDRYLYFLIGQSSITYNYSLKIYNELVLSTKLLDNTIDNLSIDSSFNTNDKQSLISIKASLKNYIENIEVSENNIPSFLDFENVCSKIITSLDLCLKIISSSTVFNCDANSINPIYSLINTVNLIKYTLAAITSSYSCINDDYQTIVSNIKSALSFLTSIVAINNDINLVNNFNSNIILKKTSSKVLNTENSNDKLNSNILPSFNFISENGQPFNIESSNLKINNNENIQESTKTINTEIYDNNSSSEESIITKSVTLNLSFYVCNLNIRVSGTIGSDNFTAYIFYSNLYNLSYFGINDTNVTINVDIPENTNKFNISECLNPSIKASSVTPNSNYSLTSKDSFNADIKLEFTLNGEVLITSILPIVIAK